MVKARWLFACAMVVGCARTTENEGPPTEAEYVYLPTTEGGYPRESHFVSDEEAQSLIDTFDWQRTEALPEVAPDGTPAMFYAVVRLTRMEDSNLLHYANVPTSIEPFFESERRELPDGPLTLSAGNTHGGFVFALMPASAYNIARRSALDGEPLFEMIALRPAPSDAPTQADGSLDMRAMLEQGFTWPTRLDNPFARGAADLPEDNSIRGDVAVAQEPLLTDLFADLARTFAEAVAAVEMIVGGISGDIRRSAGSLSTVTVALTIASPDLDFEPGAPLRRAWGTVLERGAIISMPGLELYADEVGVFARTNTNLDANNRATMTLLRGRTYRFCTVNRLGLGGTTDFWYPTRSCTAPIIIPRGPVTLNITIADQDLQNITVAADGLAFLGRFQLPVRTPVIATGNHAQLIARTGNGFVIGLGGRDPGTMLASAGLDGLIGGLAPDLFPVRAALNVDMIWPDGNPSRLVFAHEFGHHTFYQLLNIFNAANPARFAQHMLTIQASTIVNAYPGPSEPAFQPMAINEGFADILSSQLAGGTNRMPPGIPGAYGGDKVGTPALRPGGGGGVEEAYCDPRFPTGCLEFNILGNEVPAFYGTEPGAQMNNEAGRFTTTLHDFMDDSVSQPNHNGPVWARRTSGCTIVPFSTPPQPFNECPSAVSMVAAPGPSAGLGEETVGVSFGVIANGIALWQNDPIDGFVFSTTGVMRGMTRSLRLAGIGDNDICSVYVLHHPAGECPGTWLP